MHASTHIRDQVKRVLPRDEVTLRKAAFRTRDKGLVLAANLVDFQKTTFDNTAKVVGSLQAQTEKILLELAEKSGWLPKEAKKVVSEWVKLSQQSRSEFTKTMDKSFVLMSLYLKRIQASGEAPDKHGKHTPKSKPRAGGKRARAVNAT
jgi:hypothetical protein